MSFEIEMLPARNGDCLWIEYGDPASPRRILIDCGAFSAAELLERKLRGIENADDRKFELFVLTHIDSDHISGVLPLFEELPAGVEFRDIWYNGWQQVSAFLGVKQAEAFSQLLADRRLPWNRAVTPESAKIPRPIALAKRGGLPSFELEGGMKLTVLSPGPDQMMRLAKEWRKTLAELEPDRFLGRRPPPPPVTDVAAFELEPLAEKRTPPDRSAPNGSSIAFLAEFDGRAALFTGDAHADVLASSIRALLTERGVDSGRLQLDAFKLSHHGSTSTLTRELLDLVDCSRYLVPTDGSRFYHPDREAIARVILWGGERPRLYFNYRSDINGLWGHEDLQKRYGYRARFPAKGETGLRVSL